MKTHTPRPPARSRVLHFQAWVKKNYPKKTPTRKFLQIIGALDLLYLFYRMQAILQGSASRAALRTQMEKKPVVKAPPAPVTEAVKEEAAVKPAPKKTKKTARKAASRMPRVHKDKPVKAKTGKKKPVPELKEPAFELPVAPVPAPVKKEPVTPAPEPEPLVLEDFKPEPEAPKPTAMEELAQAEPEPLVLEDMQPEPEPVKEEPAKQPEPEPLVSEERAVHTSHGKTVWIDDPSMEEEDLLRTDHAVGVDGIALELQKHDIDDGQETLLAVNDRTFRLKHSFLPVNLSAMLQMARVSYGELQVHGSAGIGGLSGKGYVSAPEVARIVRLLADSAERSLTLDVEYFTQDKSSRSRTPATIRVVFERVS